MKTISSTLLLILLPVSAVFTLGATFDQTKSKLAGSRCVYFQFLSTVDSKVFDSVDSSYCSAYISKDGRFRVEVGPDYYIYNGDSLYSFSWENNQIVIEKPDDSDAVSSEISFVMKLQEWYDSKSMKKKNSYKLTKKKGISGDIPDSMVISINDKTADIKTVEYYDINGDLNHIMILEQAADSTCNGKRFIPEISDSTERIRI